MLGQKISETKGKRTARRIVSVDPPTAEVSFEDVGTMLGIATVGSGTYSSVMRPDGSLFGTGQGMNLATDSADVVMWEGSGTGKLGPGGSASYRGMLFFRTTGEKFSSLNNGCGAFEYEVDAAGNTTSTVWEWK